MNYAEFCAQRYNEIYEGGIARGLDEKEAQRVAIRDTIIDALKSYKGIEAAEIWKSIYAAHISRKSGISNSEVINNVISADNSWKKSSGHAFEEMIILLGNYALEDYNIRLCLQRELSVLIKDKQINNEVRDISWLKEQIKSNVFDLYSIVYDGGEAKVFGCIQTKTSIRDRVTRDREPSLHAMQAFFWSVALVLDGDFLRMDKFKSMVNGGTTDYPENGWHGMYVFSDKYSLDRIYPTDIDLEIFTAHAKKAAAYWQNNRQWFNNKWRPEDC